MCSLWGDCCMTAKLERWDDATSGNVDWFNWTTRNILDCDQSNYSSRIVFSHIPIAFVQTGIRRPRKPHPRTKHGVNWTIRRGHIAIWIFQDGGSAAILDLAKPEIAPFDPPTPLNANVEPNMKWIGRPLAEIWPFEISPIWAKWEVGRSLVAGGRSVAGRSSIYTSSYIDLIYSSSLR